MREIGKHLTYRNKYHPERGQTVVLMALLIVGLLAITGLAVDGGGLLFLERDAQNAVDSAVVAATYAKCTGSNVQQAALKAAADNGFENGVDGVTVTVNEPAGTHLVEISINAPKESYFIHLVYSGPLEVTANGTGRCVPDSQRSSGRALFAGSSTCNKPLNLSSNNYIEGGMHVNGAGQAGSNTTVANGDVTYVEESSSFNSEPVEPKESEPLPMPYNESLADYDTGGVVANAATANGRYTRVAGNLDIPGDLSGITPADVNGLYYVTGDITVELKDLDSGVDYQVTLVAEGQIRLKGQSDNKRLVSYTATLGDLTRTKGGETYTYTDYMLLYSYHDAGCSDGTGTASIGYAGNGHYFDGMIYAPRGSVNAGSNSTTVYGAVFAQMINISGSDNTYIYAPEYLPPTPPGIGYGN